MTNKILSLLCFVAIILFAHDSIKSQTSALKGVVKDAETGETLPFVHVLYNSNNQGITTDIDGGFEIKDKGNTEFLKFSYVGYEILKLPKSKYEKKSYLAIKLKKKMFDLNEITVLPGENPAHRILKAVLANKKINDPNNIKSYKYMAYHKLVFTSDIDDLLKKSKEISEKNSDSTHTDSSYIKALEVKKFIDSMYFFMMESVSERKYKRPNKVSEKVLVNRVSGFKNPSFMFLASRLQSFSIYEEMFNLMDKRYISPVSKGCTRRYFFNIEDTSYTELGDTVFSISYKPHRGRNFEGLKGVLNINTRNYAVQSVIAEPVSNANNIDIKIVQNYKLLNDSLWFPYELNTDLVFKDLLMSWDTINVPMIGRSKTYIKDVVLHEKYKNAEFSVVEVELGKKASTRNDSIWQKYRGDSLSVKELNTYAVIDSVGDENNLDAKVKIAQTVMRGFIPIKFIDFNPFTILDFNMYEGFCPKLQIRTNQRISEIFSIGGFGSYGFKDKQWKYGGNIDFNLSEKREIRLKFRYFHDVFESSSYSFFEQNQNMIPTENYRDFLIKDMSYQTAYSSNLEFRTLKYWKANISATHATHYNTSDYQFKNDKILDKAGEKYVFSEAALQLKYAPNEKKAMIAGKLLSISSYSSPVFEFNYIRGFKSLGGDFDYTKLEAKLDVSFLTKAFGRTYLQFTAAKLLGKLPYYMMYNGHGSYYKLGIDAGNSFGTMRMNEFLSSEFVAAYFRQDFGSLLFKSKKNKIKIMFATNVIFGKLENPEIHKNLIFNTLEKGYYESGIIVNNIIPYLKFIGYGFGVYYRYGNYALPKIKDNFAFKIALSLNF